MKNRTLYDKRLASEWIDWVEGGNPDGSREKEVYLLIKKWVKEIKPKKLVDIGCGQGICSTLMHDEVEYIGVDPSKDLIKRAKMLYKSRKFLIGEACETGLEDRFADGVMSIWVWSHLPDLKCAAKEMFRVLKPGGRFLIVTANPNTYDARKSFYTEFKMFDDHLVGTFDLGGGKYLTNTTLYFHSKDEIIGSLKEGGLIIDEVKTFGLEDEYEGGLSIIIEGKRS